VKFIDIAGQKFNKLTVVSHMGTNEYKKVLWQCICDCGNKIVVPAGALKSGNTKSCGCLKTTSKYLPADCGITDQKERNRQIIRASHQRRAAEAKEAGLCISCCKNRPSNGLLCEACTERNRVWAKKNPERAHQFHRKWVESNRDWMQAYDNKRYKVKRKDGLCGNCKCKPPVPGKARCEECSQKASDWRQANPEKVCASASRRRALMAQVLSTLTPEQWLEILEYYDRRCAYCFVSEAEVGTLHMEHVMPIFRGGTNTPDNVVPACRSCNSSKGIKTLKEWLDD